MLCAAVGITTYMLTKSRLDENIEDLTKQVNRSIDVERKANVVQRVSRQLEEIAYQQKDISDRQREEAEKQTALAVEMRRRAEEEQLLARLAESRARVEAIRADSMRNQAERLAKLALDAQEVSEHDRRVMDTLSYRTLARSLGSTSISQRQSGNEELARMLTNAALVFLDRYKGNLYQPEVFTSLLQATMDNTTGLGSYNTKTNASIRGISSIDARDGFVAVTDYGDIFTINDQSDKVSGQRLLSNPKYSFRAVFGAEDYAYALDKNGALYMAPYQGKGRVVAQLYGSNFNHMLKLLDNRLLLGGRRELYVFDMDMNQVVHHMGLPRPIQTVIMLNGKIYIIFVDGTAMLLDDDFQLSNFDFKVNGVITSAIYVPKYRYYFLGMKDGDILVKDLRLNTVGTIIGHRSAITSLQYDKDLLMSTSMDTHVYMLYLPKIQGAEYVFTDYSTELQEWVVPVDDMVSRSDNGARSWPLCSILRNDELVVGYHNGDILTMNYNLPEMRRRLRRNLQREFTPEEWTNYVSSTINYETFLDKR